jgi:hypothetical protein
VSLRQSEQNGTTAEQRRSDLRRLSCMVNEKKSVYDGNILPAVAAAAAAGGGGG